ncbi:secreted protein [Melampsora americana]|nr:secreted protein [Melampsora americana]
MYFAVLIIAILISLQAIITLPTTHISRFEHHVGGADTINEKCFGYSNNAYLTGFGSNSYGGYSIPFTQTFYNQINNNYGFSSCNSYAGQYSFGSCAISSNCYNAYTGYTGLLGGVGRLAGGLLNGVSNLVGGLGLLSDQKLKENTQET